MNMSEKILQESLEKVSISERNGDNSHEQKSEELSSQKRQDYLPWEDYFLAVAFLSAMRSKDPSTQVLYVVYRYLKVFRIIVAWVSCD